MGIRKFILLGAVLLLAAPLAAQAFDSDFERFEKKFLGLKAFHCRFSQEYYDEPADQTLEGHGQLWYQSPGLMRWSYEGDDPLVIILGKKKLWIVDPLLENVTIERASKVRKLPSLGFFFDKTPFKKNYKQVRTEQPLLKSTAQTKFYTLQPLKPTEAIKELQLLIVKDNAQLKAIAILDHANNWRKLEFTHFKTNPAIPPQTFSHATPSDMEVIDRVTN